MASGIWLLPGPAQFVETLRNELTSGRCVVVLMPRHAPDDLHRALRRSMPDAWTFAELESKDLASPAAALCHMYGIQPGPSVASTTHLLANHESFTGQLLSVNPPDAASWAIWKAFLVNYANVCRHVPQGKRSLFVTVLRGLPRAAAPTEDVALTNQVWVDVVGEIDLLLHASLHLQRAQLPAIKRNLLALSASRVALWDFEAADRLLSQRPERALVPQTTLEELATERGWTRGTPVSWEEGTECKCDGSTFVHSSMCVVQGDERTVKHRVWSAQASVILPLIEKRRLELLKGVSRFLKLPIDLDGELVNNAEDLEIGHLAYAVARSRAHPRLKQKLERLRRVRNHLAHMEALDLSLAWHDDIYESS